MNTRTLKHSSIVHPTTTIYEIGTLKMMRMSNGYAVTLPLKVNGKVVGVIEDQGNGGGAWFSGHSAEANRAFDAYVDAYVAMQTEQQWSPHEHVCNDFIAEAELAKSMKRNAKTAILLRNHVEDAAAWEEDGFAYMCAKGATLADVLADAVKRGMDVWTDGQWTPASEIKSASVAS